MSDPVENYRSIEIQNHLRKQAFRVWAVAAALVALWIALIVLPTVLPANNSSPIYHFFSFICHQMADRSFHFLDHQFAVCSRCFGVYFGLLTGLLAYPLWRSVDNIDPLPRVWLFAAMVPIGIDWSLGILGIWENTQLTRFLTGLVLGIACATYIVPALIEIARNLSRRRAPNIR
jgi:uncharacterized membrane protein